MAYRRLGASLLNLSFVCCTFVRAQVCMCYMHLSSIYLSEGGLAEMRTRQAGQRPKRQKSRMLKASTATKHASTAEVVERISRGTYDDARVVQQPQHLDVQVGELAKRSARNLDRVLVLVPDDDLRCAQVGEHVYKR